MEANRSALTCTWCWQAFHAHLLGHPTLSPSLSTLQQTPCSFRFSDTARQPLSSLNSTILSCCACFAHFRTFSLSEKSLQTFFFEIHAFPAAPPEPHTASA